MDFKRILKPQYYLLAILFLLVLGFRLFMVFQTPNFNYDAYFTLRQVENIKQTGLPLYEDPLSYGGKSQLFAPLNYYILAVFSFIFPLDMVGKILPNIFASLIVVLAYFFTLKSVKDPKVSLIIAFMAGFVPILFFDINNITVNYLAILLIFAIIYCMTRINEKKYTDYSLILMFLLVLTTPLAFLLIIGFLFYLIYLKLENQEIEIKEIEIILFFVFLTFWINLLIYKKAFATHGLLIIWQNAPLKFLSNLFSQLTFIEAFYTISIIPLILGVYSIYHAFQNQQNKSVMLLTGFLTGTFILVWFKLLDLVTGLVFLSVTLVILSAFSMKGFVSFIEKTRISKYENLIIGVLLVLFVVSAIIPSYLMIKNRIHQVPSSQDINVFIAASQITPKNAMIAATVEEGNLLAYYANRKNIADINFLLTPNINQRVGDIDTIYKTRFETEGVGIMNNYGAKYLAVTSYAQAKYGITEPFYVSDTACFTLLYRSNQSKIYELKCKKR